MPDFGNCSAKAESRFATIVQPWRQLSGLQSVPSDRHYLTMCGPIRDRAEDRSELIHMISEGIISPSQFRGVECVPSIHRGNVEAVSKLFPCGEKPTLHEADIVELLDRNIVEQDIRPAIVHLDMICTPRRGMTPLARALSALNHIPGPVLVAWNVIVARVYPSRHTFWHEFQYAEQHSRLQCAFDDGDWQVVGKWEYPGTGPRSKTTMSSHVFWRAR